MIRATLGDESFWDEWVDFSEETIKKKVAASAKPAVNEIYEAQFEFDLLRDFFRLVMREYSRGDPIRDLARDFGRLLDAWELSNRLAAEICRKHKLANCRDWTFELANLNHYNWCFWLVGLALTLETPDDQWLRLLALIGGEGDDILLDRVVASRQADRKIGKRMLHNRPYLRLLKAIDAPKEQQAALLRDFVDHWYVELARKGKNELWWYFYGDADRYPLEMGSYFGRWCIEAVAAVKAFGLDDSLCFGHEHYPGDLLRPDGPSIHPFRGKLKSDLLSTLQVFAKRLFRKV